MEEKTEAKVYIKYAVITFAVAVVAVFIVFNVDNVGGDQTPGDKAITLIEKGINTTNSKYLQEEIEDKVIEINKKVEEIRDANNVSLETIVELGTMAEDLRDYDTAIALYDIADTMNPEDLFYQIRKGRIFLELQLWEQARQVFEPMRMTFPVHEAFIGLADAYRHIEGTPDYIIDDIYLESLRKNMNRTEVVQEYIKWLEETDREDETLDYYKILNNAAPQQNLEDKIKELRQKYPNA